jgi:hypothetical protein
MKRIRIALFIMVRDSLAAFLPMQKCTVTSSLSTSVRISAIISNTLCSVSKILVEHSCFDRPNKQKSAMAKSCECEGMEHKRTDVWPYVFGLPNSVGFGIDGVEMQFVTDYVRPPLNVPASQADHHVVNKGNGCERNVPPRKIHAGEFVPVEGEH